MIRIHDIAILLATYNGAKYLSEQLDSLIAQTYPNWQLFIHDDGSKDDTIAILQEYAQKDDRIHILSYPVCGDACKNFISLLDKVDAPYYMFCDQDDVWQADKIAVCMKAMQEQTSLHQNIPIIVHSDLCVVDEHLQTINASFWQYEHIMPDKFITWEDCARGNITTGCTMLFNHIAKQVIAPLSPQTLMHDAWITLCVMANNGKIVSVPAPTILYRQHGNNTLGAHDASCLTLAYRLRHIKKMLLANWAHWMQMNAIRPISLITYMRHKLL